MPKKNTSEVDKKCSDKNATLYKFYPHLEDKIMPILRQIGLDKSTLEKEEDVAKYASKIYNVTEENIKYE